MTKRLRFEILKRDNYTCRYCGGRAPDVKLTVDHVLPSALGGSNDPSNLVTACGPCNSGKSSVGPDAPLVDDGDAERWAHAIRAVARWADYRADLDAAICEFHEVWGTWKYPNGGTVPLPPGWEDSIERFHALGVSETAAAHFVAVAMRTKKIAPADKFVYFCGCCWRHIEHLQDEAKSLLDRDLAGEFADVSASDSAGQGPSEDWVF